jgi:hypothetical protein
LSDFVLEKEALASYVVVNEVDIVVDIDNNTNPEGTRKDEAKRWTKQGENEPNFEYWNHPRLVDVAWRDELVRTVHRGDWDTTDGGPAVRVDA